MYESIVDLNLNDAKVRTKWQAFLKSLGIANFSDREVDKIDFTIGIYNGDELVATGSAAGNVLKYVGVCNKGVTTGSRFNAIVGELVNRLFQQQVFHIFVFTKKKYSESFQHIGFEQLGDTDVAAFLEMGDPNIHDYLNDLLKVPNQQYQQIGAVVMNANPFTLGHRYLVEKAAKENDFVYVFVVSANTSLFSADERLQLVREGLSDLDNVVVVAGGDYMVSYATFPAYFLPDNVTATDYQTALDARVFKIQIAPALHITTRYVGSEPLSKTTNQYNQALKRELPPDVQVVEVPRKQDQTGAVITATRVRKAIKAGDLSNIIESLPSSTYDFIKENLHELQARITKGMTIDGN